MPAGEREDRVDAAGAQPAGDQVSGAYLAFRCSVDAHGRSIITVMVDTDVLIAGAGPIGLRDTATDFARMYADALVAHLSSTFGAHVSTTAAADLR